MRVEVIECIERLEDVAGEWDSVLSSSPADTIFLTSDWLISWWKGYEPEGRLMCLAVREPGGNALGFAPFYIMPKKKAGISYKALLFLGDGTHETEYMDIFCLRGHEDAVFPLILDWLSAHEDLWDVCELNIIPENSPSLALIKKWGIEKNGYFSWKTFECSHIKLPDNYDKYLDSLSKNHRGQVRNSRNRALKKGAAVYEVLNKHVFVDEWLSDLYDLHTRRWNSVGQPGSFADSGRILFYKNMTARFMSRGWLRLCRLSLLGRTAAVQIGFLRNRIYSFLQEGFEPELAKWKPGVVLRAMTIQDLIEERAEVYDFLGYPTPAKERWNTSLFYSKSLTIARQSFRARTVVLGPVALRRIRCGLARLVSRTVPD